MIAMASKKNRKVDAAFLTLYKRASRRMFGDFQSERLAVAVGEALGRELAMGSSANQIVQDIVECINASGLGSMRAEKPPKGVERYDPISNFYVKDSIEAQESEKADKPVCQILRGIIRGALAQVYHQENIAVKETKCAALGEKECVFEAYWVPM